MSQSLQWPLQSTTDRRGVGGFTPALVSNRRGPLAAGVVHVQP